MKKILLTLTILSLSAFMAKSQSLTLRQPSSGKAMVYIMRTATAAPLIKFSFFHGEKYLGKFNGGKYLVYEVEPGEHLFWVKSENTDFIEAELEAGRVYILDTNMKMRTFKAAAVFVPLDRNHKKYDKHLNRVLKLLAKDKEQIFTEKELAKEQLKLSNMIQRIQEKYIRQKNSGKKVKRLTADMYHNL